MCRAIPSSGDAPPTSPPPRALFISSVVFLSIFSVAFAVFVDLPLCCCRRTARTSSEHAARAALSGERGDRPFLANSLPVEHGGTVAVRECAVCLGAGQEGEMVRRLPACRHVHHVECIDRWLAAHRTCALCRSELDPCKVNSGASPPPTEADPPDHQLPV
ncbi:hypothetical protein SETIT_4G172300v2 [Setaria italica]|uniref:RING-type E3 ubiquitin transferase n=1 Tax=Setaria italica TaxID=4555 RepID=K3Y346_SETIT|nr:hypothetical protein SETIT_4G172300v2 [Setaria italica]